MDRVAGSVVLTAKTTTRFTCVAQKGKTVALMLKSLVKMQWTA